MNGKRKATITDVARLAGVSTATAGRVLGGYGYSSGEKKDRVLKAAEDLGYRPNLLARGLITGRTRTIGFVAGDIASPFYARILRGVSDALKEQGFGLLITTSDETLAGELESIRLFQEKQVDGIILSPCDTRDADHLRRLAASIPMVLIDREVEGLAVDSVGIDNVAVAEAQVAGLIAAGHHRIGMVAELHAGPWRDLPDVIRRVREAPGSLGTLYPSWQRFIGYVRAHHAAGLEVDPSLTARADSYAREAARLQTARLLALPDRPTALFTADGVMTEGAMAAVVDAGLRLPQDLSFLAFDDLDWMDLLRPGIDAISQPRRQMGEVAARMLIDRLDGLSAPPRRQKLAVRSIVRGSVISRVAGDPG